MELDLLVSYPEMGDDPGLSGSVQCDAMGFAEGRQKPRGQREMEGDESCSCWLWKRMRLGAKEYRCLYKPGALPTPGL